MDLRVSLGVWLPFAIAAGAGTAAWVFGLPASWGGLRAPMHLSQAASEEPPARRPVKVDVAEAEAGDVAITLTSIGTVQAFNTVSVRSRIDGEITAVLFREGQSVQAGDALATIDDRLIQAQVDQHEANLLKDQALVDGATLDLQRYESLVTKSFTSQQQVDQQRALVAQYRAQVKVDAAQIAYARTQLGYTTITSPITGRTGVRMIDVGNYVRAGDASALVVVSQVQPISVIFTLPANAVEASRLTLGETNLAVVAYAADGRTPLDHGTIDLVDNLVDQSTGTIKLKATFPNAELRLWPGGFVEGRLTVDTRHDAVTVPETAVRHGPRGDFAFLVQPDHTVTMRDIAVGQAAGGRVLVEKGIDDRDLVVTDGQLRLENGMAVEIASAPTAAGDAAEGTSAAGEARRTDATPDQGRRKPQRRRDPG